MSNGNLPASAGGRKPVLHRQGDNIMADSRDIAMHFDKRHDHVLSSIDMAISRSPILGSGTFIEKRSPDPVIPEKTNRYFEMNRDGFSLIAMGFTGEKAFHWKLDYITAFNTMENALRSAPEKSPYDWMRAVVDDMEKHDQRLFSVEKSVEKIEKAIEVLGAHEDYMTIKQYAGVMGFRLSGKMSSELGKQATKLSRQNKVKTGQQPDATYGHVNTYHRSILEAVFKPFSNL
jgi:Rha family phage regulatory protein